MDSMMVQTVAFFGQECRKKMLIQEIWNFLAIWDQLQETATQKGTAGHAADSRDRADTPDTFSHGAWVFLFGN